MHFQILLVGLLLCSILIVVHNRMFQFNPQHSSYRPILFNLPVFLFIGLLIEYSWMLLNKCKHLMGWDKYAVLAVGLISIGLIIYFTWVQSLKYIQSQQILKQLPQQKAPERILSIWQSFHSSQQSVDIQIISASVPFACSAGLFRPTIYLSDWLLQHLSDDELKAILAHEWTHIMRHDILRGLWHQIISQSFSFLPGLRSLKERLHIHREFNADQQAIQMTHQPNALASALMKFYSFKCNHFQPLAGCVHFNENTVVSRIESLIDHQFEINAQTSFKQRFYLMFSFVITAIILMMPLWMMDAQGICYL